VLTDVLFYDRLSHRTPERGYPNEIDDQSDPNWRKGKSNDRKRQNYPNWLHVIAPIDYDMVRAWVTEIGRSS
jgi:hypothetical protein